jgi:hypothetical protein
MSEQRYIQSVMDQADDSGFLSPGDTMRLLADHNRSLEEWKTQRPMGALPCEARPLLHWLGYR